MTALETRVQRLERQLAPDPDDLLGLNLLSDDAIQVLILRFAKGLARDPKATAAARSGYEMKIARAMASLGGDGARGLEERITAAEQEIARKGVWERMTNYEGPI